MPYFPILQKPTQNNLITKTSFRQDAPLGAMHHYAKTAEERIAPSAQYIAKAKNRRRAVSYVSTGLARLPRDTNASPIYRRRAVVETSFLGLHSLVAERRHSSVTRYAKRSVACRDSPRHQPLRAGGTPLPRPSAVASPLRPPPIGLPHRPPSSSAVASPHRPPSSSDCASHIVRHPSDCANGAIHLHRRKTAEERFNMLARGWLAYPVTPTHHPSTAEERLYKRHPSVCTLSSQSDGTLP